MFPSLFGVSVSQDSDALPTITPSTTLGLQFQEETMESYIPPEISKFQGELIVCFPVFLTKMFITKAYDDADGQVPEDWIRTAQSVVPVTGGTGTGTGIGDGLGDGGGGGTGDGLGDGGGGTGDGLGDGGGGGTGDGLGLGIGLGIGLGMVGNGGTALPSLYHGSNPTFCK